MNLSSGIIHIAVDIKLLNLIHAGMAELADALDLESSSYECRFDSCYPHQIGKNGLAKTLFDVYS